MDKADLEKMECEPSTDYSEFIQPLKQEHLAKIVKAANAKSVKNLFDGVELEKTEKLLKAIVEPLAQKLGCKICWGPLKKPARAAQKVESVFGGDWYDLKDIVRMTLIADDQKGVAEVRKAVEKVMIPSEGRALLKNFEWVPDIKKQNFNYCGYSGIIMAAVLSNNRIAEIQVNVPEIIYAEQKTETFEFICGKAEGQRILKEYGVQGALGHIFYELYRNDPKGNKGQQAAALATEYFRHLRGPKPTDKEKAVMHAKLEMFQDIFAREIDALKKG